MIKNNIKDLKDKELVVMVDRMLRDSFKEELKTTNSFGFFPNQNVLKRVRSSYYGEATLPIEFIRNGDLLYPKMPWEETKGEMLSLSDEDYSDLHIYELLVSIHISISVNLRPLKIFSEYDLNSGESDIVEFSKRHFFKYFEVFQLLIAQNIVETEKYIARGMTNNSRNNESNALINILEPHQFVNYTMSLHKNMHDEIEALREIEVYDSDDRRHKIMLYKALHSMLREFIHIGKFLAETASLWQKQKIFYGKDGM